MLFFLLIFFLSLRQLNKPSSPPSIKCPPSDNYVLPPLLAEILNKRPGAYSRKCGIQICRLAVSGSWDYPVCESVLPRSHFGGIFWSIIFCIILISGLSLL